MLWWSLQSRRFGGYISQEGNFRRACWHTTRLCGIRAWHRIRSEVGYRSTKQQIPIENLMEIMAKSMLHAFLTWVSLFSLCMANFSKVGFEETEPPVRAHRTPRKSSTFQSFLELLGKRFQQILSFTDQIGFWKQIRNKNFMKSCRRIIVVWSRHWKERKPSNALQFRLRENCKIPSIARNRAYPHSIYEPFISITTPMCCTLM